MKRYPPFFCPESKIHIQNDAQLDVNTGLRPEEIINTPIRLLNRGNDCYVNSIFQSFIHVDSLREWTKSIDLDRWYTELNGQGYDVALDFIKSCKYMIAAQDKQRKGKRDLKKKYLKTIIENIHSRDADSQISGNGQQDAQEFLNLIISTVRDAQKHLGITHHATDLSKLLEGETVKHRTCCRCNSSQILVEPWNMWTVSVNNSNTLTECFAKEVEEELFADSNEIECDTCGKRAEMVERYGLNTVKDVFIINMRQFQYQNCELTKINSTVDIPLKLELFSGNSPDEERVLKYRLCSVVTHYGNEIDSGHYMSYVRTESDKWFRCDDLNISAISPDGLNIFNGSSWTLETPYILFYQREF